MAKLFPPIETIRKIKPLPTDGEWALLNFLENNYNDEYEIYFQSFLNGDRPDVVLMRKGGGIVIFEVKDWNLDNYTVIDGEWIVKSNGAKNPHNPLRQVLKYKENLFYLHNETVSQSLLKIQLSRGNEFKMFNDFKRWYVVTCAIYFHCHTTKYSELMCLGEKASPKYEAFFKYNFEGNIIGNDGLNLTTMDKFFNKHWINKKSIYFTDDLYISFHNLFKPSFHTIEQGHDIILTKAQTELSISIPGQRKKIKGFAGSGKSFVLAQRAVNAHILTGLPVLILTYNITLRNYIHDRISSVRKEFNWSNFHISNYHEYFNGEFRRSGLSFKTENPENPDEFYTDLSVYSNPNIFEDVKDNTLKYKTILIDEAQDFEENWIRIIVKYFAEVDAEIVVFGDGKQNIYSKMLENETKMPRIPIGIGGQWDSKLKRNFRHSAIIAKLSEEFQKRFFLNKYDLEIAEESSIIDSQISIFDEPKVIYNYLKDSEDQIKAVSDLIYKTIKNNFHVNDVTILSSSDKIVREIDKEIREKSKQKTNSMLETEEVYQEFTKNKKEFELERIRKNKKLNFWINSGTIKLSTIHSFKGWESPVVFLILTGHEIEEIVYTGFTRAKSHLYILNLSNQKFHDFFNNSNLVETQFDSNNRGLES